MIRIGLQCDGAAAALGVDVTQRREQNVAFGQQGDGAATAADASIDDDVVSGDQRHGSARAVDQFIDGDRAMGRDMDRVERGNPEVGRGDIADLQIAGVVQPDATARDGGFQALHLGVKLIAFRANAQSRNQQRAGGMDIDRIVTYAIHNPSCGIDRDQAVAQRSGGVGQPITQRSDQADVGIAINGQRDVAISRSEGRDVQVVRAVDEGIIAHQTREITAHQHVKEVAARANVVTCLQIQVARGHVDDRADDVVAKCVKNGTLGDEAAVAVGKNALHRHVAQRYLYIDAAAQAAHAGHVEAGDRPGHAVNAEVAADLQQIHIARSRDIKLAGGRQRHAQRVGGVGAVGTPDHAVIDQRQVAKSANGGNTVEVRVGDATIDLDQYIARRAHAVEREGLRALQCDGAVGFGDQVANHLHINIVLQLQRNAFHLILVEHQLASSQGRTTGALGGAQAVRHAGPARGVGEVLRREIQRAGCAAVFVQAVVAGELDQHIAIGLHRLIDRCRFAGASGHVADLFPFAGIAKEGLDLCVGVDRVLAVQQVCRVSQILQTAKRGAVGRAVAAFVQVGGVLTSIHVAGVGRGQHCFIGGTERRKTVDQRDHLRRLADADGAQHRAAGIHRNQGHVVANDVHHFGQGRNRRGAFELGLRVKVGVQAWRHREAEGRLGDVVERIKVAIELVDQALLLRSQRRVVDQRSQFKGAVQDGAVFGTQRHVAAGVHRAGGVEGAGTDQLQVVLAGQNAIVDLGDKNVVTGLRGKTAAAQNIGVDAQRTQATRAADVGTGTAGLQLDAVALHQRGGRVRRHQAGLRHQGGVAASADDLAELELAGVGGLAGSQRSAGHVSHADDQNVATGLHVEHAHAALHHQAHVKPRGDGGRVVEDGDAFAAQH